MKSFFIDKQINYDGRQLAPHWIYKNFNVIGDAICAFIGEVKVELTEMVDVEDVINNEPIYSESMLNFIVEFFGINLSEGVLRQRLLITTIKETIEKYCDKPIKRNGDDIFIDGKKLSVSIATTSSNSVLIHTALNLKSENTPIPVSTLPENANIFNVKEFAQEVMTSYTNEIEDIYFATCKVRGV